MANSPFSILALAVCANLAALAGGDLAFLNPSNRLSSTVIKDNRVDFIGGGNARRSEINVTVWPRDKVFLDVGGDVFLWGPVWDYVEIYLNAKTISVPPGSTFEDIQAIREKLALVLASKVAKMYLPAALLAHKARSIGLKESDSKLDKASLAEQYIMSFPEKHRKNVRERLFCPGGYYTHCLDTMIMGDAYREVVLKPQVKVSDEDVTARIRSVEEKNVAATNDNAVLRASISAMRADIVAGKLDFSEAARRYSECDSAESGGYWGCFDPDDNNLLPEIRAVVFNLPTNTISEVVETPESYHIFRVLDPSEKLPQGMDEDDEDEEDEDEDEEDESVGGPSSRIRLCHIMLEKRKLKKVPTREEAYRRLFDKRLAELVLDVSKKLLDEIPVTCALPDFKERFKKAPLDRDAKRNRLKAEAAARKEKTK